MRNREFNERATQQETKLRRYDNHRTNIPPVDRPIILEQVRTLSPVQHYHLWHNGQELVIPKRGTQAEQQSDDEEFIDYPIEIKNYSTTISIEGETTYVSYVTKRTTTLTSSETN